MMKFNPVSGFMIFSIFWIVFIGHYIEYLLSRPTSPWIIYPGGLLALTFTAYLIYLGGNLLHHILHEGEKEKPQDEEINNQ